MTVRHNLFLDAFSPDYRRYFGLFQPRERVKEPLSGEPRAHYEWLTDVLYTALLLAKNSVFVPHAFVLQCPLLSRLIERNRLLIRENLLRMPMGDATVGESLDKMRRTFPRQEFPRLFSRDVEGALPAISEAAILQVAELTNGIARIIEGLPDTHENGGGRWQTASAREIQSVVETIKKTFERGAPITFESSLRSRRSLPPAVRRLLFSCIHYAYGIQHVREYGLAILTDIPGIHDHFGIDSSCISYSYRRFWSLFSQLRLNRTFLRLAGPEGIVFLRRRHGFTLVIDRFAKAILSRPSWRERLSSHILRASVLAELEHLARVQADIVADTGLPNDQRQLHALRILDNLSNVWGTACSDLLEQNEERTILRRKIEDPRYPKTSFSEHLGIVKGVKHTHMLVPRVALLTVIGPELSAVKRAFAIPETARVTGGGDLRYEVLQDTVFNGTVLLEIGCIGKPGNSASAAAAAGAIYREAKFVLLCGIAAGIRTEVNIGDVIVPEAVVDATIKVATDGALIPRPQIVSPLLGVLKMNAAVSVNRDEWKQLLELTLKDESAPSRAIEDYYPPGLPAEPKLRESAILSDNLLIRNPKIMVDAANNLHQKIRAGEMEAAGVVEACSGQYPPVPWFVIRGISDFGDSLKNDLFHRLAASAVASYVKLYLKNIVDLTIWNG